MERPVVIITGASSGFGLLATIEFVRRGYFVIATMRDLNKKEKVLELLKSDDLKQYIQFLEVDVTKALTLNVLKSELQKIGRVDILINNAGFATGGFSEEVSLPEFKAQFETNFFGVIEVTKVVLPFMRERQSGKIINISSISGQIGFPGLSPYVASKYALEGWSECLRLEVNPFGIDVALVEPGSYQTNIWSSGKKIAEKSLLSSSPYQAMMKRIELKLEKDSTKYGNPLDVVHLIVKIANEPRLYKLRFPVGKGVKNSILLKQLLPWKVWEKIVFRTLGLRRN
ncbi:SDR family oxidoreductase [Fredinandcohnia sp. 179-A 10B2 NHS]|uniref:SDR family oxidoreductase n=1 Tax=Fredinandcohnia sp. 179-A 10B2 NHS TaxID=3235176 RepID=UPI0039A0CF9A